MALSKNTLCLTKTSTHLVGQKEATQPHKALTIVLLVLEEFLEGRLLKHIIEHACMLASKLQEKMQK